MAALYGIVYSNRDFSDQAFWGKNQFNSSFPVALACYMRDKGIPAVYLTLTDDLTVSHEELPIGDVFGSARPNADLVFNFESRYRPFQEFVYDELETIDLVVKDKVSGYDVRPLEVKLTTLPDSTTESRSESEYGSEIVIRSATMRYLALSMASSLRSEFKDVRSIFESACLHVRNWGSEEEVKAKLPEMLAALEVFFSKYRKAEKPFLMQPIWKTIGRSPQLADHCLDIFVWSDFALTRLFMDSAKSNTSSRISRQQRAAARLARFLFEISGTGKILQKPIYDVMSFDSQTDKEFSISGSQTNRYMKCERLLKPSIHKSQIKEIILGGGQKWLSPERRFDAILYFANGLFE